MVNSERGESMHIHRSTLTLYLLIPSLVLSGYLGNLEVSNSAMLIPSSIASEAGTTGCMCMPQWLLRTSTILLHVCRPGRLRTSLICCAVCRHRRKGEVMTQCISCRCECSIHNNRLNHPSRKLVVQVWEIVCGKPFEQLPRTYYKPILSPCP